MTADKARRGNDDAYKLHGLFSASRKLRWAWTQSLSVLTNPHIIHVSSGLLRLSLAEQLPWNDGKVLYHQLTLPLLLCLVTIFLDWSALFDHEFRSLVKPWLDPVTVNKIQILGSDYKKTLLEQIPPENLPQFLGGTCNCEGGCQMSDEGPWKEEELRKKQAASS